MGSNCQNRMTASSLISVVQRLYDLTNVVFAMETIYKTENPPR